MAHLTISSVSVAGNTVRVRANRTVRNRLFLWPAMLGISIFNQLIATWIDSTHTQTPCYECVATFGGHVQRFWYFHNLLHSKFVERSMDAALAHINLSFWVIYRRARQSNGVLKRIYVAEHFVIDIRRWSENWISFSQRLWLPLFGATNFGREFQSINFGVVFATASVNDVSEHWTYSVIDW